MATRINKPTQEDFNCHQGSETCLGIFTKAQLGNEDEMKSSDFTSRSGSKEMVHKIGMNDLFVNDSSSLTSDMPSMKEGQEVIPKAMLEDHRDTTGGGLTSGHIRSLDVNNDCMAGQHHLIQSFGLHIYSY